MASATSQIEEFPQGAFEGLEVVNALADRYAHVAASVREQIDTAEEAGGISTSDLFIEVCRALDKSLWFLEAHLQS